MHPRAALVSIFAIIWLRQQFEHFLIIMSNLIIIAMVLLAIVVIAYMLIIESQKSTEINSAEFVTEIDNLLTEIDKILPCQGCELKMCNNIMHRIFTKAN
jgi:large-conductance mechanosensitive channel